MSRYARRKDATHNEIAKAFEKMGYSVADTSRLGDDFPDMLIAKHGTLTALIEAKSKGGRMSEGQDSFRRLWKGLIYECRSVDDVVRIDREIMRLVPSRCKSYADVSDMKLIPPALNHAQGVCE